MLCFCIRLQELRVRTLWVRMVFTAFDVVRGWAALNGCEEVPVDMSETPDLLWNTSAFRIAGSASY